MTEKKLLEIIENAARKKKKTLDLSGQGLKHLPAEIGQLTNLTQLYLSDNQLSSLPAEIGQLTNLTKLYLCNNQLSSLPAEIGQLTNLTMLYLSGNQLSSLPAEIGQLSEPDGALFFTIINLAHCRNHSRDIRSLKYLLLHGNSQLGIPLELLGPDPMKDYH